VHYPIAASDQIGHQLVGDSDSLPRYVLRQERGNRPFAVYAIAAPLAVVTNEVDWYLNLSVCKLFELHFSE